jgi:hypothetical protein
VKRPVAGAIVLESGDREMRGPSVELDYQALGAPHAIALEPATADEEAGVDLGAGEPFGIQEGEETGLELASGDVLPGFELGEDGLDGGAPPATWISRDEVREREEVGETMDLSLVHCSLHLVLWQHGGEVKECTRDTRHRDTPFDRALVLGTMDWWSVTRESLRRDRHSVSSSCTEWKIPQSDPADRWLSTAPGPVASKAAIQRPSVVSVRWPTA